MRRNIPWVLYLVYCPQNISREKNIISVCIKNIVIKIVICTDLYMTKYNSHKYTLKTRLYQLVK